MGNIGPSAAGRQEEEALKVKPDFSDAGASYRKITEKVGPSFSSQSVHDNGFFFGRSEIYRVNSSNE